MNFKKNARQREEEEGRDGPRPVAIFAGLLRGEAEGPGQGQYF